MMTGGRAAARRSVSSVPGPRRSRMHPSAIRRLPAPTASTCSSSPMKLEGAHFTTATGCTGNMVRAAFGVGGNSAITVFYEAIGSSGSTTNCTLTASGATVTNATITAATFENVLQTEGLDDQTGATLALYNAVSGGANAATPGSIDLTGTPATPEGGLVVYGINVNGTI